MKLVPGQAMTLLQYVLQISLTVGTQKSVFQTKYYNVFTCVMLSLLLTTSFDVPSHP